MEDYNKESDSILASWIAPDPLFLARELFFLARELFFFALEPKKMGREQNFASIF
jgi:hypothetical protein